MKLDYKLPPSTSEKFGLTVEDEKLGERRRRDIMNVGWRHRSKATGLTKPDYTGQPIIIATRPPAEARLGPLVIPGNDGAEASEEEEKHEETEEQWEVQKIYAPPMIPVNSWQLTDKDGESINLEQFAATAGDRDLTEEDYIMWIEASFVGWSERSERTRSTVALQGMASGEKLEKWKKEYDQRAAKGLKERMKRDRAELKERANARAHFASVLPAVEDAAVGERYMGKVVGEMVPNGGGNHQRAYKAWGRQKLESVKLEEYCSARTRRQKWPSLPLLMSARLRRLQCAYGDRTAPPARCPCLSRWTKRSTAPLTGPSGRRPWRRSWLASRPSTVSRL
jgi:hypothetical protein